MGQPGKGGGKGRPARPRVPRVPEAFFDGGQGGDSGECAAVLRRVVELTAQPLGRALRQYLRTHLEAWETGDAGDHSHFSSSGEDPQVLE